MYTTLYAIHDTDADHLAAVTAEMRERGAPLIRVVDCGDHWRAIEGSHRIRAAADLGLPVEMIVLEQDDMVDGGWIAENFPEGSFAAGESYTAGELVGELAHPSNIAYRIEDGIPVRLG